MIGTNRRVRASSCSRCARIVRSSPTLDRIRSKSSGVIAKDFGSLFNSHLRQPARQRTYLFRPHLPNFPSFLRSAIRAPISAAFVAVVRAVFFALIDCEVGSAEKTTSRLSLAVWTVIKFCHDSTPSMSMAQSNPASLNAFQLPFTNKRLLRRLL